MLSIFIIMNSFAGLQASAATVLTRACTGLVSPTEPDPSLLESALDSVPVVKSDEIIQALSEEKIDRIEAQLGMVGIPVTLGAYTEGKRTAPVFTLDLEVDSSDPMMRAIHRLKESWDQKTPGAFPKIRFAPQKMMEDSNGFYLEKTNEILIHFKFMSAYLKNGEFPWVLQHELRHAGFVRFQARNDLNGLRFLGGRFITDAGKLSVSASYEKYITIEETYTFIRDLRKKLTQARDTFKALRASNSGAFEIRSETAIRQWADVVFKFEATQSIYEGVIKEAKIFKEVLADEKTVVSIPLGFDRAKALTYRDGVEYLYDVDCPGCAWKIFGRRGKAEQVIRDALHATEDRLKESSAALQKMIELEIRGHRIIVKMSEEMKSPKTTELINELSVVVDEMLEKTVTIIKREKWDRPIH